MSNPFISQPYIDSADALYEQAEQQKQLYAFFQNRADAAIFGPEGTGKSVLLRCFFNHAFCREMAQKGVLIYMGEFPQNLSSDDTYGYFADAIRLAVEDLEFYDMSDRMNTILRALDNIQADSKSSRFNQYLHKLQKFGFRLVFVLDNFENFTSSPNVKPEHHDLLCGFLNANMLQLIVATNFDFNETSLPAGTRNSKLLTRLSPHSIYMTPLDIDSCKAILGRNTDFRFTDQQIALLHSMSGGIPTLLYTSAKHGYDVLQECGVFLEAEVRSRALQEALPILKRWCKVTPDEQLDLLSTLREKQVLSETQKTVAGFLEGRGLLCKAYDLGRNGRRIPAEGYMYNSGLFRAFCGHREWLDEVLEKNPLRKEPVSTEVFDPASFLSKNMGGNVFIEKVNIHHGDDNRNQQNVTYQPTIIADKGFARLFGILDLQGEELGGKLLSIFKNTTAALPEVVDADTAAEETAERITSMFIPEEIEAGSLEEYQEEQKTLESRFSAIRSKIDPEGMVDDALLNSLSTKCRLYLQIAFVVDDALSTLNDFHLGDLSAQMVMYGKVLEQQLKDNLYQLFRKDDKLKDIDVFTKFANPQSRNSFGYMKLDQTSIGNYMCIMRSQSPRLAELCRKNSVCFEGQVPDEFWWEQLGADVDAARKLRNGGDHAGTETSHNDMAGMRRLLFGEGKILRRCDTGGLLTRVLWPASPRVAQPVASAIGDDKAALIGQTVNMTDVQVTPRNSIRGTIAGTSYGVSISRRHLEDRNCRPQDLVGKTIRIRIMQWDNNPAAQKFNAELP
ncbi:MAG: ATP-binding protein [Oscillospiraceae bacterium]|nr:ATP-binding protein [Oscillospiraceae bacterium]MBQ7130856.1 ATP-binding protein [Oscillospiraceae bacterium]